MNICRLKIGLLISECTSMILAKFAQELKRPLVILPLEKIHSLYEIRLQRIMESFIKTKI